MLPGGPMLFLRKHPGDALAAGGLAVGGVISEVDTVADLSDLSAQYAGMLKVELHDDRRLKEAAGDRIVSWGIVRGGVGPEAMTGILHQYRDQGGVGADALEVCFRMMSECSLHTTDLFVRFPG